MAHLMRPEPLLIPKIACRDVHGAVSISPAHYFFFPCFSPFPFCCFLSFFLFSLLSLALLSQTKKTMETPKTKNATKKTVEQMTTKPQKTRR